MITFPETVQDAKCHRCELAFIDLTFVWYDGEGCAECPECGHNIWITEDGWPSPADDENISWRRGHTL